MYKLLNLLKNGFLLEDLRVTAILVALLGAGLGFLVSTGFCVVITVVLALVSVYPFVCTWGSSGTSGDLGLFLMCFLGSCALCVPMWLVKLIA